MCRYRKLGVASLLLVTVLASCAETKGSSREELEDAGGTSGAPAAEAPRPWTPHTDMPDCRHVEVKADCRDGWCRIPAGCFVMGPAEGEFGAPLDEYRVSVVLTHAFEMQQTELMVEQWQELGLPEPDVVGIVDATPCSGQNCPAVNVSWYGALLVANRMSELKGLPKCYELSGCKCYEERECEIGNSLRCAAVAETTEDPYACEGYRLPTEAEWEYAARAGTQTAFYNGDITPYPGLVSRCEEDANLKKIAWYCKNADGPMPVGQKEPNGWGLCDMLGNVREWTSDPYYRLPREPVTNPRIPWTGKAGLEAVVPRGGAYDSWAAATRTSWRYGSSPRIGTAARGIRLVRTLFE